MKDLLLDDGLDLMTDTGDFSIGEATEQHQNLLLLSGKMDWKEKPQIGCNVIDYIHEENIYDLFMVIKKEFENDGMEVEDIKIEDLNFKIDAKYV